jgi:ubiquinone/menaquinone biosynthesis C-methylase UbiE
LRDQCTKKNAGGRSIYVTKILAALKPQGQVLDIGCGTAHIIQELARCRSASLLVGLDVSAAMLSAARDNTAVLHNVGLVEADGHRLPFPDCSFDAGITRLASYSPREAYRVLRTRGTLLECGLGPKADREIKEFFPERIETENFCIPQNRKTWMQEACHDVIDAGFTVSSIKDYEEADYYEDDEAVMNLIDMVPLVKDFDRERDRTTISELAAKYRSHEGVKITWHYYIMIARKP